MARKDIVVLGASAGGMEALLQLCGALPENYAGSLFIAWHMAPGVPSLLPGILTRAGPLRAAHPADGDPIEPGRIYVAPNDHHLLLEQGYMRVTRGPKENRFRPAADPLFRSAAYVYGPRAVGVVLSGALDDGTSGLYAIKMRGGTAIVQDPADAKIRSMPLSAREQVDVDHRAPANALGALLARLAMEPAGAMPEPKGRGVERLAHELRIAGQHDALNEHTLEFGELSPYTCPECHGVLVRLREGPITRYRCHTGHAFSTDALLSSSSEQVENRLWDSVRGFDELVLQLNAMGEDFLRRGDTARAEECFDRARDAHRRAQQVRAAAFASKAMSRDELGEPPVQAAPSGEQKSLETGG